MTKSGRIDIRIAATAIAAAAVLTLEAPAAWAGFNLGDAANFAVLYNGAGNNQLSTTNVTITGNIGIGDPSGTTTSHLAASGPGTINGNVEYAGAVSGSQSISNTTITGTVTGGNANVQTDLNNLSALSTSLGAEAGTNLTVNLNNGQSQTVNISNGVLDASGNEVFKLSALTFNNGSTLTIDGNAAGNSVVFDVTANNPQFGGTINLVGLNPDQVLFNVVGTNSSLQINTNGSTKIGDFLDPNGPVSMVHSTLDGRLFGGDASNMQIVSGDTLTAPSGGGRTPVPEPSSLTLLAAAFGAWRLLSRRSRAA